jgi:hypothetical protein
MSDDNLDKYLPEFDEEEMRERLAGSSREELTQMLIYAYKEKRVFAKMADVAWNKLNRIKAITDESSAPAAVPTSDDLRRMLDDEQDDHH